MSSDIHILRAVKHDHHHMDKMGCFETKWKVVNTNFSRIKFVVNIGLQFVVFFPHKSRSAKNQQLLTLTFRSWQVFRDKYVQCDV